MTWSEIKKAVAEAGVEEDDEICSIQCENGKGDKKLHRVRLGRALKLTEVRSESREDYSGCAT